MKNNNKKTTADKKNRVKKNSYSKPKLEKLGKLKNITMGASLAGGDTLGQLGGA